jgi:hypothetical protein
MVFAISIRDSIAKAADIEVDGLRGAVMLLGCAA